ARRELTKPERQVAAIVEQTLHALIDTDLTVADIMDAAAESARPEAMTPHNNGRRKQHVQLRASH
ncbi:MAG: hypothetical protein WBZ42_08625, partial [Halobacteriota archaeon]